MLLCIMAFNAVTKYRRCNMSFSSKDKAVNINLHQLKEYGLQRILIEFSKKKLQKGNTGHFTKKTWEMQSTDQT